MSESTPDYSGDFNQALGLYNKALDSYHPSAQLDDYTHQMMNDSYNQGSLSGLSGSTIQQQNLAEGITKAGDADQQQFLSNLYGLGKPIAQTQFAVDRTNANLPLQIGSTLGSAALGGFTGGVGSAVGAGLMGAAGSGLTDQSEPASIPGLSDISGGLRQYAPYIMSLLSKI